MARKAGSRRSRPRARRSNGAAPAARCLPMSSRRRLIAGLGNPGREYEWTPHNLGFLAIEYLAERAGIRVTRPESGAITGLGRIAGQEVALAIPQMYMNASGKAIQ